MVGKQTTRKQQRQKQSKKCKDDIFLEQAAFKMSAHVLGFCNFENKNPVIDFRVKNQGINELELCVL